MKITTNKRTTITATAEIEPTAFDWLRAERVAAEYVEDSSTGRHLSVYAIGHRIHFENFAEERIYVADWPADMIRRFAFPLTDKLTDRGMPGELRFPMASDDPGSDAYALAQWAARTVDSRDEVLRPSLKTINQDWEILWGCGEGEAAQHPVRCGKDIAGSWRFRLIEAGVIS